MFVAIGSVHFTKGFFVTNGGWELNSAYIASALAVAFAVIGRPLDSVFNLQFLPIPRSSGMHSLPRSSSPISICSRGGRLIRGKTPVETVAFYAAGMLGSAMIRGMFDAA